MAERCVLFVDDEEFVLHSIRRSLYQQPYHKIFAKSSYEALNYLKDGNIHVIMADIKMPITDGVSLLAEVKTKYPQIVRIAMSGYSQITQLIAAINKGEIFRFLAKPWDSNEELIKIIQDALQFYDEQEQYREALKELTSLRSQTEKLNEKFQILQTPLRRCRVCQRIRQQDTTEENWQQMVDYLAKIIPLRTIDTICPDCQRHR